MRAILFILTCSTPFCMPLFAHATVFISEVAWMGTAENANAEWIELYNTDSIVSLEGWTLSAKDGQPAITLSGSLEANTYALLERTSDTTVPSVSALLVYTGALGNDGEKLELRDHDGTLVDSVDGLDAWSIGGSNETKDTLQRRGEPAVGAWFTAPATPLSGTDTGTEYSAQQTQESTPSGTRGGSNILYGIPNEKEDTPRLEPALILDLGEEKTVTVGVPATFLARAFKERGQEIVVSNVVWNFGDGTTKKGREVSHVYRYTGEYVVSATGHRSGFLREITDTVYTVVHVVEPSVEVVDVTNACMEIKNKGTKMADISGHVLVSGSSSFTIPQNTLLLPNASVRFPRKTTGIGGGHVHLFRPDGSLLSIYGASEVVVRPTQTTPQSPAVSRTVSSAPTPSTKEKGVLSFLDDFNFSTKVPELTETVHADIGGEEGQGSTSSSTWVWVVALISAIATAGFAVVLLRHEQQEVINGFLIDTEDE